MARTAQEEEGEYAMRSRVGSPTCVSTDTITPGSESVALAVSDELNPDLDFEQALAAYESESSNAHAKLVAHIYADLRILARRQLGSNRWIRTLDTTSLVNEAYFRLVSPAAAHARTRAHFMNLAAQAMRQIILDYARKRMRDYQHIDRACDVDFADGLMSDRVFEEARDLLRLDDALKDLAQRHPRQTRVVECRFFAGYSEEETAQALGIPLRTVQRDWSQARKWLENYMRD